MTLEFLVLGNIVLLARLFVLFKDDAAPPIAWIVKTVVELAALFTCYQWSAGSMYVAGVLLGGNVASMALDRWHGPKNLRRLLVGLGTLVALSLGFAPFSGLVFSDAIGAGRETFLTWSAFGPLADRLLRHSSQLFIFGLLLSANEANLAIRAVFERLDLKPRLSPNGGLVDVGEFNRGRVIGLLERVLLYVFILQGHYGAIGFVLAAKAFTRFKALDDRPFAEYVLIGTLLSACLALAAGTLVKL